MAWNTRRKLHIILIVSVLTLCVTGISASLLSMTPSEYRRNWLVLMVVPMCCVILVGTSIMLIESTSQDLLGCSVASFILLFCFEGSNYIAMIK